MKTKLIFSRSLFFLFLLFFSSRGGLLEESYNPLGIPQSVFYYPSLLAYQTGLPISLQVVKNSSFMNVNSAVAVPFRNSGLAFGYQFLDTANRLTIGFGHDRRFFNIGSSFSYVLNEDYSDVSLLVSLGKVLNKHQLALIGENIAVSQRDSLHCFGLKVNASGPFAYHHNIYSYDVSFFTSSDKDFSRIDKWGGQFRLKLSTSKPPLIHISTGYEFISAYKAPVEMKYYIDFGVYALVKPVLLGLSGGYEGKQSTDYSCINGTMFINPKFKVDRTAPELFLSYKEAPDSGVYFSLRCTDDENGSGIEGWVLTITPLPKKNAPVLKTFSGGSVAPSVVQWDGRDSRGKEIREKQVYAILTAVDKEGNGSSTEWKLIEINSSRMSDGN